MVTERYLKLLSSFGQMNEQIDLCSLDTRVIFQKKVYFLQEFGCKLGYSFGWYLKGPYSTDLTSDAYQVKGLESVLGDTDFGISLDDVEEPTEKLKSFLTDIRQLVTEEKAEDHWLELAGSLHFLKFKTSATTREKAFEKLEHDKPGKFSNADKETMWPKVENLTVNN